MGEHTLERWLDLLGHRDCTCTYEMHDVALPRGRTMAHAWVRVVDNPTCPHHGGIPDE